MYNLDGALYISGSPDRPRGWYANVTATPQFTLHLKESVHADLPARARPVTDLAERRAILERIEGLGDTETLIAGSPLIEIEIAP